jgi:hypothetical protein
MIEKLDDNLVSSAIQEILSSCDLLCPPSDFQKFDILRDNKNLLEFKQQVVIPIFAKYFKNVFNLDINTVKYKIRSWIAGTTSGYMIPAHNHSGAVVSAVFYLLCDEQNRGGELYMMDPRINANRGYTQPLKKMFDQEMYTPKSAEVVVFPSFMYHYTLPFTGKMRLAMPVDFFL